MNTTRRALMQGGLIAATPVYANARRVDRQVENAVMGVLGSTAFDYVDAKDSEAMRRSIVAGLQAVIARVQAAPISIRSATVQFVKPGDGI